MEPTGQLFSMELMSCIKWTPISPLLILHLIPRYLSMMKILRIWLNGALILSDLESCGKPSREVLGYITRLTSQALIHSLTNWEQGEFTQWSMLIKTYLQGAFVGKECLHFILGKASLITHVMDRTFLGQSLYLENANLLMILSSKKTKMEIH